MVCQTSHIPDRSFINIRKVKITGRVKFNHRYQ